MCKNFTVNEFESGKNMNHKIIGSLSSSVLGASFVVFIACFSGHSGATIEGAATLLLASFVGFGVSRFYQATEHMVSIAGDGGFASGGSQKLSDVVSKG